MLYYMDGSGGGNTMGRSDSLGGKPKSIEASTPAKNKVWLRENKYGQPVRGKYGVYIMICLDFLNEKELADAIEKWGGFFGDVAPQQKPKRYDDWAMDPWQIYKPGRTKVALDRYFKKGKTKSISPPNMDMWLYHTWVTFDNPLNAFYGMEMNQTVEANFLEKVTDWRMDEELGDHLGMKEMTFGLSLEDERPKVSLQYYVHLAVIEEIEKLALRREGNQMKTKFRWKANGTVRGMAYFEPSDLGKEFTMDCEYRLSENQSSAKGSDNKVPIFNRHMTKIIRNARIYLEKSEYEQMYRWLEHVDCYMQRYPDYNYTDDKKRLREAMVEKSISEEQEKTGLERIKRLQQIQYGALNDREKEQDELEIEKLKKKCGQYKEERDHAQAENALLQADLDEVADKLNLANEMIKGMKKEIDRLGQLTSPTGARKKPRSPTQEVTKQIDKIKF